MTPAENTSGELYVLWHARHLAVEEDGRIIHREPDGSLHLDEEEWRIIGIYSRRADAEKQKELSRFLPGFQDEPDCFEISPLVVDENAWEGGFFTEDPEGQQFD